MTKASTATGNQPINTIPRSLPSSTSTLSTGRESSTSSTRSRRSRARTSKAMKTSPTISTQSICVPSWATTNRGAIMAPTVTETPLPIAWKKTCCP